VAGTSDPGLRVFDMMQASQLGMALTSFCTAVLLFST